MHSKNWKLGLIFLFQQVRLQFYSNELSELRILMDPILIIRTMRDEFYVETCNIKERISIITPYTHQLPETRQSVSYLLLLLAKNSSWKATTFLMRIYTATSTYRLLCTNLRAPQEFSKNRGNIVCCINLVMAPDKLEISGTIHCMTVSSLGSFCNQKQSQVCSSKKLISQ